MRLICPAAQPRPAAFRSLSVRTSHQKRTVRCRDKPSPDAIAGNGAAHSPELATAAEPEVDIPSELLPLKEALDSAQLGVQKATTEREIFEEKAESLADKAVDLKNSLTAARSALKDASAEQESLIIGRDKAEAELAQINQQMSSQPGAWATNGASATQTIDMRDGDESQILGLEAESELQQSRLWTVSQQLNTYESRLTELESSISQQQAEVQRISQEAQEADDLSAQAMQSAESAVQEEMEALAVSQGIQEAFSKALVDLHDLGESFKANALRSTEEQEKRHKRTLVEAQAAMDQAVSESKKAARKSAKAMDDTTTKPADRGAKATPAAAPAAQPAWQPLADLAHVLRANWIPVTVGVLALAAGGWAFYGPEIQAFAAVQLNAAATQIVKVSFFLSNILKKLPLPEIPMGEHALMETVWLLLTSVIMVPLICKLPGGSAVLGFLAGGALIGPHALGIIQDVEGVRHLAELGVVFLLFNIGLELSLERLQSMQKYVFGMGTTQVVVTLALVGLVSVVLAGVPGPSAVILGGGLALSSTAVAMQVLQDRGETGSRHGRAAFAVLLLQDLAVVVLLMLIPLLAPSDSGAAGLNKIAAALGVAAVKAVVAIVGIIAGGRVLLRPIYRRIADLGNTDVFAALTLLVVLGTSMMTQLAGLSLALGAFLAGLLVAETEYALQVESDIAPYKGLLMGLFFMTVGMEISVGLFFAQFRLIMSGIIMLIAGKTLVMTGIAPAFGLSRIQGARAGLLLAAGGEFAFVAFGEAVSHKILPIEMVQQLFLVVALSMALTPFLAEFGQRLGKRYENSDMKALQVNEGAADELKNHVIIAGFGRVGQIIGQLLSERLIPFVALDVRAERVSVGKNLDLPVYFGDAGSPAVLHSIGAHKASCAVVTLDSPGANYRTVWALNKHFPGLKVYVRAHDVDHGRNLEKAGATAVVPETLEPSLLLASAVLSALNMDPAEVANAVSNFRKSHMSELQQLCKTSGGSLGYGFTKTLDDDEEVLESAIAAIAPTARQLSEAVP